MLSIGVLKSSAQAGSYYAQDDYYTKAGAAEPSHWDGKAAAVLGLAGEVDRAQFEALLNGVLPNGVTLKRGQDGKHQPGWDLTFSAPKSVSLLALVGADSRVIEAHDLAVSQALRYLESETAQSRIKQSGKSAIETTGNWISARFNHDTSRELDPQLHTHAVVINATQRSDGEWRALSSKEVFRAKMLGGAVYRAELARGLQRLGYEVEVTHQDGRFEVKGFSKEQLRHFSRRREEIEAALASTGASGAKASASLALYTRARKGLIDRAEVYGDWQARAAAQGIDFVRIQPRESVQFGSRLHAGRESVAWAIDHLTERESVFRHRDLLRKALEQGMGRVTLSEVQAGIKAVARREFLIPVSAARYTTTKALRAERETVFSLRNGTGRVSPIASHEAVTAAAGLLGLSKDQSGAAALILTTSDRIVGVQGYAGTGKTHMLRLVRQQAEKAGITVRGFAPSAAAATVLQQDTSIPSDTVSRHLLELGKGGRRAYAKELWIVDEASMLSTEQARRLVKAANQQDVRMVLVGDRQQLAAVEAGRPFAMLLDKGMAVADMRDIKRQKNPNLKAAVLDSIAHREAQALDKLSSQTRVITDRTKRIRSVVEDYLSQPATERHQTLVVTGVNEDRRDINERIREALKREGAVTGPEVETSVLVQRDLTRAEISQARLYEVGDLVRFGRGYAKLGVEAGTYLEVLSVNVEQGSVRLGMGLDTVDWEPRRAGKVEVYRAETRQLMAGEVIRWTRNDRDGGRRNGELATVLAVDAESRVARVFESGRIATVNLRVTQHWEHGYASTVHAAQGKTADRVLVHLDSKYEKTVSSESFYVAISRARHEAKLYTDDRSKLAAMVGKPLDRPYALETSDGRAR
jgi:conjugative relaxase-like TrwC/TraI family protein